MNHLLIYQIICFICFMILFSIYAVPLIIRYINDYIETIEEIFEDLEYKLKVAKHDYKKVFEIHSKEIPDNLQKFQSKLNNLFKEKNKSYDQEKKDNLNSIKYEIKNYVTFFQRQTEFELKIESKNILVKSMIKILKKSDYKPNPKIILESLKDYYQRR